MFTLTLILTAGFFYELESALEGSLDIRLDHEVDHMLPSVIQRNETFSLSDSSELLEPDLVENDESAFYLLVVGRDGRVWVRSENTKGRFAEPLVTVADEVERQHRDKIVGKVAYRIAVQPLQDSTGNVAGFLHLMTDKASIAAVQRRTLLIFVAGIPVIVAIILAFSILLARRIMRPITTIIELSDQVTAEKLDRRVQYEAEPEDVLGRLRDTLNALFARLEREVDAISHFSDNAAHQLMTPLTALSSELEYHATQRQDSGEFAASVELLRGQVDRMIHIVRVLLMMARGTEAVKGQSVVNVSALLRKKLQEFNSPRVMYRCDKDLFVRANSDVLWIAFENLLSNAVKYAPTFPIHVVVTRSNGEALISVADEGKGIPDGEKDRIFERFYRSKESEKLGIGGYGLGLSLVRSIAMALNGVAGVEDNMPRGSRFFIRIPLIDLE